jgi:hypothetical protein
MKLCLQPAVLIDDGVESAHHHGGRLGLAPCAVTAGDRLPQRMPGGRQLGRLRRSLGPDQRQGM